MDATQPKSGVLSNTWMPDGNGGVQPAPLILTEAEVIRLLRLDTVGGKHPEKTLARYRANGLLRATRVGNHNMYFLPAIVEFAENQTQHWRKRR